MLIGLTETQQKENRPWKMEKINLFVQPGTDLLSTALLSPTATAILALPPLKSLETRCR